MFDLIEFDHELVAHHRDVDTGLRAIIAIHSTALGPAIGGCRMMDYTTSQAALTDVLRLSRGMTLKCAIAQIPFGGGKAVILGDPSKIKSTALLHAMGRFVDGLGGRYITSFDAGTTLDDVKTMGEVTAHVGGIAPDAGNASQSTAMSVYLCMKRSALLKNGSEDLSGARIAIQGTGNVGARLARLVAAEGAQMVLADARADVAGQLAQELGGEVMAADNILQEGADIFAPCALGGVLNERSVNTLGAKIVCGGANNQLTNNQIASRLEERDVFYCPDFIANGGGITDLHYQLNGADRSELPDHLERLAEALSLTRDISGKDGLNMADAAEKLALERTAPV